MATLKPTTAPAKRLSESISGASSSFKLNNLLSWQGMNDGSTLLTSADFGTRTWAVFRNSAGTLMEIMEIDPTTITAASSPITILYRGLKFDGTDQTEVSANKLTWIKGDTIVELGTHVPQMLAQYVDKIQDQTVGGVKTFSSLPATTAGNPVAANDLARKAYVDSVVAGIATSISEVVPGTAGETLVAGDLVYLKLSDNRWWKTDADTASTVENVLLGMAQGAGTAGNAVSGGIMLRGVDTNQSGLVAGEVQYASNTAGDISNTPGTTEVTVGVAKSATELYFDPRFNQQITEDQQDALAGNSGTPSATNKYVTQKGMQVNAERYAVISSGSTTAYTATFSPAPTSLVAGMHFFVKIDVTNTTTTPTLNPNSLGATTIVKGVSSALSAGDLVANQIAHLVFNGTNFVLQNPAVSSTGFLASGYQTTSVANGTTTILTLSIPGGTLSTNKGIRIRLQGTVGFSAVNSSGGFIVKYGGTTLVSPSSATSAGTPTGTDTIVSDILLFGSGATNTQRAHGTTTHFGFNASITTPYVSIETGNSAIDSTADQDLVIQITSAHSAVTTILNQYFVEKIV